MRGVAPDPLLEANSPSPRALAVAMIVAVVAVAVVVVPMFVVLMVPVVCAVEGVLVGGWRGWVTR